MQEPLPLDEFDDGYTGWDLPENPELRAWIESLPPLGEEAMYQVIVWTKDLDKSTYHLVTPVSDEQAFAEFDLMFLAAHNGAYGEDVVKITLLSPERRFVRKKLASVKVERPL